MYLFAEVEFLFYNNSNPVRSIILIAIVMILGLFSCKPAPPTMEERVQQLGRSLVLYSRSGGTHEAFPKEVVFVGVNTFWELFQITDPIDSIGFAVFDGAIRDDEADYLLDIGYYLGLRIRYDEYRDQFHILGYSGAVSDRPKQYLDTLWGLHEIYPQDSIIEPYKGLGPITLGHTTKVELFKHHSGKVLRDYGLDFTFSPEGIVESIFVFSYGVNTTKGIGTRHSSTDEVCKLYGDPDSITETFNLNGRLV